MAEVVVYTDGSCKNLTGDMGGYGIVMINGSVRQFCGGSYYNTSSPRMEVLAIVKALGKCERGDSVIVYSDNQYAVNTLELGWIWKWNRQNFRGRKNKDLWVRFIIEYRRLKGKVKLKWLRGHDGNHYNEVADLLAKRGANRKKRINDSKIYTA